MRVETWLLLLPPLLQSRLSDPASKNLPITTPHQTPPYTTQHPLRHISGLVAPAGASSTVMHVGMGMMDDEEGGLGLGGALSAEAQAAAETGVYLSYILGMLGTYGGRTLRAIHDTLKIWASGGDAGSQQRYTMKLPALERLLGQLVLEEKVEVVDGIYQLKGKRGV